MRRAMVSARDDDRFVRYGWTLFITHAFLASGGIKYGV